MNVCKDRIIKHVDDHQNLCVQEDIATQYYVYIWTCIYNQIPIPANLEVNRKYIAIKYFQ